MSIDILQVAKGWRVQGFGTKFKELGKAIDVATEFLNLCARRNANEAAKAWRKR